MEDVTVEVEDYMERFYNRQRRHSTLGYLSPVIYERRRPDHCPPNPGKLTGGQALGSCRFRQIWGEHTEP